MLIYKILRAPEWQALQTEGRSDGAPADVADGYVHFSAGVQVPATLEKHFAGERDLMLLAVDTVPLGVALRWEPSRGGAHFPHLYRELRREDIAWARPLDDGPAGPVAPADLE